MSTIISSLRSDLEALLAAGAISQADMDEFNAICPCKGREHRDRQDTQGASLDPAENRRPDSGGL
ncbi:hypothetical protein [Allochromatium vinosum]|uniref:hypothetical protein n=1 Tax=Allochromatium vinosum TaxID=1049 RepID=UPI001905CA62|nr:hypothetical protein [Allochromatium vinosum]